jgi:cytochrome c peroxidase
MEKQATSYIAVALFVAVGIATNVQAQLTDQELLGKFLFFDKTLSSPTRQACADCHAPRSGWTTPEPGINLNKGPHPGAVQQRSGARKPPTVAYATHAPNFGMRGGRFEGGNFWDGRATGDILGSAAADQALDPFFAPVEMNLSTRQELCEKVAASHYADLFESVWGGADLIDCQNENTATEVHHNIARSISAYEDSPEVNQFSSKFDDFLAGRAELTEQEARGWELFQGRGNCSGCHSIADDPPLFTSFRFFNIGVPKNPKNPVYKSDPNFIDGGLGAIVGMASEFGKHKAPTLRNVDARPGRGFTKAYMHNGVFKSLKEVVHFYNARDIDPNIRPSEVSQNRSTSIGNLGLTPQDEDDIVVFLGTLSDRHKINPPKVSDK